jgi:hypothetical protein
MSAALQENPSKEHTCEDDLESFVHVLTWLCLRYMKTTLSANTKGLADTITDLYESYRVGDNEVTGGRGKSHFFMAGLWRDFVVIGNPPLTKLIQDLRGLFKDRYLEGEGSSQRVKVEASALLKCFNDALDAADWPSGDAAVDQLPKALRGPSIEYSLGALMEDVATSQPESRLTISELGPLRRSPRR